MIQVWHHPPFSFSRRVRLTSVLAKRHDDRDALRHVDIPLVRLGERRAGAPTVLVDEVDVDTLLHESILHRVATKQPLDLQHVVVVGVRDLRAVTTVSGGVRERKDAHFLAVDRHPVLEVGDVLLDARGRREVDLHDFVGHDDAQRVIVLRKVLGDLHR